MSMIAIDETGKGEPLVLLHGVGANRGVWRRVTPVLAADHLVLAPDLPGFGESAPTSPGFDLDAVAEALADALAERTGGSFSLLGNSLGGAVAVRLTLLRPELVSRLVLAAPAGFSPRPWPVATAAGALLEPMITFRRVLGTPIVQSATARRALLWGAVAEPRRMSADDARIMLHGSRGSKRIGSAVAAVLQADLRSVLGRVETPLGVIWGRSDRVVPIATLDRIKEARPDVVVATIPGAGHVPQMERPTQFVRALRRVLQRLS